jgi:hypothetical protein
MSTESEQTTSRSCGCSTEGGAAGAPRNRPGQPALSYRTGDHGAIRARMLARLAAPVTPDGPSLADLTTRANDDPTVAVLDAWAATADVLSFYNERIANEGFLRTATERRSVLELARAIGYELAPGVAASTTLAFTVEDAAGAPETVVVPAGTKVMSVPAPGTLPQTFETSQELLARATWNALTPRQTEPQAFSRGRTSDLFLKGVATGLKPGDPILIVGDERRNHPESPRWDLRIVTKVTPFPAEGHTLVAWRDTLGHEEPRTLPASENPKVFALRQRAALFGHNAPSFCIMPESVRSQAEEWPDFKNRVIAAGQVDLDAVYPSIFPESWAILSNLRVVELYRVERVGVVGRDDFALTGRVTQLTLDNSTHLLQFGLRDTVVLAQSEPLEIVERPRMTPVFGREVELTHVAPGIAPGHMVVVSGIPVHEVRVAPRSVVVRVKKTTDEQCADPLALRVDGEESDIPIEAGQRLAITEPPQIEDQKHRYFLRLDESHAGSVVVTPDELVAEPPPTDAPREAEVAFVESVSTKENRTTLTFEAPLAHCYHRKTVVINANTVLATHGETVRETLGSGNAGQSHQRFDLTSAPLTHVSADTARGVASALEVRVNGARWQQVPSFFSEDARSECYVLRIADDGTAAVIFGDGLRGSRLPSGVENITAVYRRGIGPHGEVAAHRLTLLPSRPQGVREVTNPLAASGAAAPETLATARTHAPLAVQTLDRIVSLTDYESFARTFGGVGKAQATTLWDGGSRFVHVTVAAASGARLAPDAPLLTNLRRAMAALRDPQCEVRLGDYEPTPFGLTARVLVDPRHVPADVLAHVGDALRTAFAFERRELGEPLTAAEVMRVILAVPGTVAAVFDRFARSPEAAASNGQAPSRSLSRSRQLVAVLTRPRQILNYRRDLFAELQRRSTPAVSPPPTADVRGPFARRRGGAAPDVPPFLPGLRARWDKERRCALPAQLLLLDPAGVTLLPMED